MNIPTRYRLTLAIFAAATFLPIVSSSAQSSSAEQADEDIELDIEYPTSSQPPHVSCYQLADAGFNACMELGNPRLACEIDRRTYKETICKCQLPEAQQPPLCGNDPVAVCEIDYVKCAIGVQVSFEACLEDNSEVNCRNISAQELLVCEGNLKFCVANVSKLHFANIAPQDVPDLS